METRELRLQCLRIAQSTGVNDIVEMASALEDYVLNGRSPSDLKEAALALYMAGHWLLENPKGALFNSTEQARLWVRLRDALGLDAGHATSAGGGK
jgi:hypothetical protein